MKIFEEIAKKFGVKIIDVEKDPGYIERSTMGRDYFVDWSCLVGANEMILGIYTNPAFRVASFFHELGHLLVPQEFKKKVAFKTYPIEKEAWRQGFGCARAHGVRISNTARAWARLQLETYNKPEYR